MASYTMCHLKIEMLLRETGYSPKANNNQPRLNVYLTNSLEEAHPDTGSLFASWLSKEATAANFVKRDTPVMCIIGNPPYSAMSINQGKWINSLIEDYKYIAGNHFGEKKHWLNDDYVKFIRYGQYYIEKNKQGILAFINPHGFLSNPTFRGMRWNLLKTFDKIYAIDLHGNSNRLEKAPNGSPDVNVFDIQQGVSINIFIKTGKKQPDDLGTVFTSDMYGQRDYKYNKLFNNKLAEIPFKKLNPKGPYYFFVEIDDELWASYNDFLSITQLFNLNTVGFVSANDGLNISFTQEEQREKINDILSMDEASWRIKYKRPNDAQSWKYEWAKEDARKNKAIDLGKCQRSCRLEGGTTNETGKRKEALDS